MSETKTYYDVQVVGRDGRYQTKLTTTVRRLAEKEAKRQESLNWSGRVVTQATMKVVREW